MSKSKSKVLVNVHGAGKQMSDFYKEALTALTRILHTEPPCLPCWYADLSNIGSPVLSLGGRAATPKAQEFQDAFLNELKVQQQQAQREQAMRRTGRRRTTPTVTDTPGTGGALGIFDLPAFGLDAAADVTRYLFDARLRGQIQERLDDVLTDAAKKYKQTVLVSHSLGTVVAFDVLHERAKQYKISRFITMGSPLRKLVNLRQRSSDLGAINPDTVPFWRNLYDTTDAVADAIGPAFPGYAIEDVFVQVADLPIPSHDYWRNKQTLEMIAGWMS